MYLTDLADACRKSGLVVVEEPDWKTHGHGPLAGVASITCHHTAGPASGDRPSLSVVRNGRPGLEGPLSQLFLSRSGVVHVVAAGLAYHAGVVFENWQSNAYSIGIEAEATGTSAWPPYQYDAYARLCRALADHYGIPTTRIVGHKEIAKPLGRKIDPNFDMNAFRRLTEEVSSMDWNYPIPDYYKPGLPPLPFANAVGYGIVHAANARDRATEARNEVRSARAEIKALSEKLAQVQAGNVDYELLAKAVADELAKRLDS